MPAFLPGLELSRRFYQELVKPLLEEAFPALLYAAALIGHGSEVLGFDTEMSRDHDWGPRLFIFLTEEDAALAETIHTLLSQRLPSIFLGYPVNFEAVPGEKTGVMKQSIDVLVNHRVFPVTLRAFMQGQLGYDIQQPLQAMDWLTFPSQALREVAAGAVYHDGTGELTTLRAQLTWYPHDVWLYLLAAGWQRIGQEEHLMPRAGYCGEELGSAIIGSRLVRDIMHLCFLMEKQYAPYPKWLGTAFNQLQCSSEMRPLLWHVQQAPNWQERESALIPAYQALARMHNALKLTQHLPETVSPFYDRPFQVIHAEVFARYLLKQITDPEVQRIAARPLIGNIDQWSDNTDMRGLEKERLRQLYMSSTRTAATAAGSTNM